MNKMLDAFNKFADLFLRTFIFKKYCPIGATTTRNCTTILREKICFSECFRLPTEAVPFADALQKKHFFLMVGLDRNLPNFVVDVKSGEYRIA